MQRLFARRLSLAVLGLVALSPPGRADEPALIHFGRQLDWKHAEKRDATAHLSGSPGHPVLSLRLGHHDAWPGITFAAPPPAWDLSAFGYVVVKVKNVGTTPVRVGCRLDSPASGAAIHTDASRDLAPGETGSIRVPLLRRLPAALSGKLFGMRGLPGGCTEKEGVDPARVTLLRIFAAKPTVESAVDVLSVRAVGMSPPAPPDDPAKMFPMIDPLGQYAHAAWPGKTGSVADLARQRLEEAADLGRHPGPPDWDRYGGWAAGPQLAASGFFYPVRHDGKWWLVDPEGRLFWSHGIDGVRPDASTPITDRRHWFAELPERGSPLAVFFGNSKWAPHGYYQGKDYETYNFYGANLCRKYGAGWHTEFIAAAAQRLRSWGMNTAANWSDPAVCAARKTPYVVSVYHTFKPLVGSSGYWGQFADVFDTSFRDGLREAMAREKGRSAGDPWCLGYFVGNELSWGDDMSLSLAALASPSDQPAKRVFLEDLQAKYRTIDGLNRAWGTLHASWQALLESRRLPDRKKAHADLTAFSTRTAEQFFRLCREAVKEAAPHNLYLGCRFAAVNDLAVQAAAKFCDVVSYNLYRDTVADFRLPQGIDRPVVIGEFHFGALDRGMFHAGLRPVENQAERAKAYLRYVRGAIGNPALVGTHWFQWVDEATTGRGDGENYQIGFVDVCDKPYPETIQACRAVAASLYATRVRGK